jgi:hypothetical protein
MTDSNNSALTQFISLDSRCRRCRTGQIFAPPIFSVCAQAAVTESSHWLFLRLEESSNFGSGGIWVCDEGGSGVAASLFRVNARPRKPIAIKTAPAIISQWGNPIDESRPIYFSLRIQPKLYKPPLTGIGS